MSPVPNIISSSRGIAGFAMLLFPVFSPWFWTLYCWGGVSDMIDGPLARKLVAVSKLGSRIDSLADIVFAVCAGITILPSFNLPFWIWLWVAVIGITKTIGISVNSRRHHRFTVSHSILNRLTGLLLFCLPLANILFEVILPVIITCFVATLSILEDITTLSNCTFRNPFYRCFCIKSGSFRRRSPSVFYDRARYPRDLVHYDRH